jgi:hypothetical protein
MSTKEEKRLVSERDRLAEENSKYRQRASIVCNEIIKFTEKIDEPLIDTHNRHLNPYIKKSNCGII